VAIGDGQGERSLNPTTKVFLGENSHVEMELSQLGGVSKANRLNDANLSAGSSLIIKEHVLTDYEQSASSENNIILEGDNSSANMVSRSVIKGNSRQFFMPPLRLAQSALGI